LRSWFFFLQYCLQRQARARLLVIISFALLGLVALLVHLNTRYDRWSMMHWRVSVPGSPGKPQPERVPLANVLEILAIPTALPLAPETTEVEFAIVAALNAILNDTAGPRVFTGSIVVGLLGSFLMPLWTLTFATEALGRARETRTLTWLFLRPLARWSMYLAAFMGALPGALLLNVGGFVVFCLLGGTAGQFALPLFWLPIVLGTLAFTALFQLLSVLFQRAGILGLLYVFFLEMIAGNLPGQQKLLSISFYIRCLMMDRARGAGMTLDLGGTRPPVSGETATVVLLAATAVLLGAGMVVFARKEFVD